MPYIADPNGYGKPILTPEEAALLAADPDAIPPPDTSMYAAPVESQYQVGGANYVPPYDPGAQYGMGASGGDPAVTYAQNQPTDPYNTAPSGTYPSDPIPTPRATPASGSPYTSGSSALYGAGAVDAFNGGYPVTGGTRAMGFDPDPTVGPDAIPPPNPATAVSPGGGGYTRRSPSLNWSDPRNLDRRAYEDTRRVLDVQRANAPRPTQYNWDAAEPEIPSPAPTTWTTGADGLDSAVAQLMDDSKGLYWDDLLNPRLPEPQTYPNDEGRQVMGGGEVMFMPGPIGGAAAGAVADDVARAAAGSADDIARAAGTVADDAARTVTMPRNDGMPLTPEQYAANRAAIAEFNASRAAGNAADDAARTVTEPGAIPEPNLSPRSQRVLDAAKPRTTEEIARAANTQRVQAAYNPPANAPRAGTGARGTTPNVTTPNLAAAGAPARRLHLPRPTKRGVALAAGGLVGGGVLAGNLLETGEKPGSAVRLDDASRDAAIPDPIGPGSYNPSTNPETPAEWDGATTRSLELMKAYSPREWAARTTRSAVDIDGTPRKLIASADVPGLYVGYVDANGNVVPVGNDVTPEDFLAQVTANAAEAPAGWGDSGATADVPTPDEAAATPATTLDAVSIPAPDQGSSGRSSSGSRGSSRSSGGGSSRSSGGGGGSYRSSGRGFTNDDGDAFTADDFMDAAKGDRRKAERMARMANKRRRNKSGGGIMGGFWDGFPFNRPPSPIREHVLTALQESRAAGARR